MAKGIANASLVGNVGGVPETRFSQNGTRMTTFSVAVNRDGNRNGESSPPDWYRIVCFGKLAEIADQYVTKGKQVYVGGRLRINLWEGNDGVPRTTVEVVANDLSLLGARDDNDEQTPYTPKPKIEDDLDTLPF